MSRKIQHLLAHRLWTPMIIVLSVCLLLGSLGGGLVMDDHIQRLMLIGSGPSFPWPETSPWDLYALVPGDEDFMERSIEQGIAGWWGSERFQASFWRPLSSATIYLDYLLWPDHPWLMHAQSLLWLVLLLIVAAAVYRRFFKTAWMAGLSTTLFALDDAHIIPATWVANRNSLIATIFALLAILAHDKWRREQWSLGAFIGPFALAVGLLAGEFALGICAFLFSYAVFLESGRFIKRLTSLLPYLAVVIVWRLIYNAKGYGAYGSDLYLDPLQDPLGFSAAALERLPLLLFGLLGFPGSEIQMLLPSHLHWIQLGVALLWLAAFAVVVWPLLREDRRACFFGLGTILSLLPAAATFPHDRLLLMAGLGGMGLMATLIGSYLQRAPGLTEHRARQTLATVIVAGAIFSHLVLSPLSTPWRATLIKDLRQMTETATFSIEADEDFSDKTLVIANAPDLFLSTFQPVWRESYGLEQPRRFEILCNSVDPVTLIREGERTLLIDIPAGHLRLWSHHLVRRSTDLWPAGRRVKRPGIEYEVLKTTPDGQPETVRATFAKPLEDPSLKWVRWHERGYVDFEPPALGKFLTLDIDPMLLFNL